MSQKLVSKLTIYSQIRKNFSHHQREVYNLCKQVKHTNCFDWDEWRHLKVVFLNGDNEQKWGVKKIIFAKCLVCNHVLSRNGKIIKCKRGCAESPWNKIKPEDLV